MYNKKGIQILLAFMIIFMIMGSVLNTSMINNLNSTEGNTTPDKNSINQNTSNENGLIEALGDENTDNATKISATYEFLKSKLYSFGQKSQDITVSKSQVETDDSIVEIITIRAENETHIETMTFTVKFDKDQYSGPLNEDVDFLLTPDDVEHHSAMIFPPIIMGWQWGWWYHYEWEYEIKVKILWWTISIFRAYFEISVGAFFRFQMPVLLTADVPDIILPGETKKINLTLTALDLKNPDDQEYYEFVLGIGLVLKAGAYILGVIGFGYNLDLGWFEYQSYKTPLHPYKWYPMDPIRIGLIGQAAKIAPPSIKPILVFIADNLLDASIFIYPGIASNLVTAQATVYGTGVTINDQKSLSIQWTQSPSTYTINLTTTDETTDIALALSKFTIHINEFCLKFDFAIDYQWIPEMVPGIPDYTSWEIGEWVIATPFNIFTMQSPQAVYIPFSITPREFGVDLLDISPTPQDVEVGGTANYTLSIQNTGNTIDTFRISVVSGIDPDWVIFFPKYITLGPDEINTVEMIVYAPRDYTTLAGPYTFIIEARSQGNNTKSDDISGVIEILPFYDVAVRRISQFETGVITITTQETDIVEFELQNLGNVEEIFSLSVSSDLSTDCFNFPAEVTLLPGETVTVQVEITPEFVHSAYYEAILTGTSTMDPLIQDDGSIIIRVLPTCDSVIYFLNILQDQLFEIPLEAWRHPSIQLRNAMNNKINALINIMSGCNPTFYEEAYDKLLHDIKPKLTGLKTDEEETPWDGGIFKKPWIIDTQQQAILKDSCNRILSDIRILIEIST